MRKLLLTSVLILAGTLTASAQDAPHDFRQDTPPAPGQIVETPREKLHPGPRLYRDPPATELGLPTNGPKAVDPATQPHQERRDESAAH